KPRGRPLRVRGHGRFQRSTLRPKGSQGPGTLSFTMAVAMATKRFKAAVIGGSGYGGAELIRRLLHHPHVELVRVASIDYVGEPLANGHMTLEGQTNLRSEGLSPAEAAAGMDVVLLGLPHKVSATKMPELMATGARVVDLSGDCRLRDPAAYKRYYGADHPCPERLTDGTFVYGLPELHREAIR